MCLTNTATGLVTFSVFHKKLEMSKKKTTGFDFFNKTCVQEYKI